jgi:hypothetical protein
MARPFYPRDPDGQQRIILQDRTDPYHHCVQVLAQAVDIIPGSFAGDPARIAGPCGHLAIKAGGYFQDHERSLGSNKFTEGSVQFLAFLFQDPRINPNPGSSQLPDSASRNKGVGVLHSRYHPSNPSL